MASYEMPWEYSFSPFYTLQHHEETKKRQIAVWGDIVLKYHKSVKKNKLSLVNSLPIFSNESIGRKAPTDLILQIITFLQEAGYLHPLDKDGNEWSVCWHTIDEYADLVYNWASDTGHVNAVCTLFELSDANPELSQIDENILLKALRKLEARGKCEVINMDGSYGVKFF